jgi:hypothetical protein
MFIGTTHHFLQKLLGLKPVEILSIVRSLKMVSILISSALVCQTHDEMIALIDAYLNGARTLSNDRLSYLIISSDCSNTNIPTGHSVKNYDLMICATHFLGDGMALHQFANDFFVLLGSSMDETALLEKLTIEWSEKYTNALPKVIHNSILFS